MKFEAFAELYAACEPMRKTVSVIDTHETAVLTCTSLLSEAIQYYQEIQPDIPIFILIDWDGKTSQKEIKAILQSFSLKITVYPYTKKDSIPQKKYCLYTKNTLEYWRKDGLLFLYQQCLQKDFPREIFISENSYRQFGKAASYASYIKKRLPEAFVIYQNLADDESRQTYLQLLKAFAAGNPDYLPFSLYPQYRHPQVCANSEDTIIIDGGVLNGITCIEFLEQGSAKTKVLGFEPVPSLYAKCQEKVKKYPNITMVPYALWDKDDTFYIENMPMGGSRVVTEKTANSETCRCISLDSYYAKNTLQDCSLIKLDIEGAEPQCLQGAKETIAKYTPKLHISIYHGIEQFFDIPLYLLSSYPHYTFYLGHHSVWFFESILYAKKNG